MWPPMRQRADRANTARVAVVAAHDATYDLNTRPFATPDACNQVALSDR